MNYSLRHFLRSTKYPSISYFPINKRSDTIFNPVKRRLWCVSNTATFGKFHGPTCHRFNVELSSYEGRQSYATRKQTDSDKKDLVEAKESPYAGLTTGQKVKEAGKDASYAAVIAVGVGVTGLMFYMIGRELFSSQSPSGIYGDALKKCEKNDQLISMLGEPMKGYGETTRRGRRRHVSHQEFNVGGVMHMRMRFYVEGPHGKATVTCEMRKNDQGKYDYRYVVAELEGYPRRSVLVVDNT